MLLHFIDYQCVAKSIFALRQKWKNRTIFSVGWLLASNGKSRWHSGGWGGLVGMWSVWKTVPSEARVTRDEVSGLQPNK